MSKKRGKPRLPRAQRDGIRDRLSAVVIDCGGRDAFERLTGISRRTLEGWLRGQHPKVPSETQLVQLAEEIGLSPSWLLVGNGPRYLRELQPTDSLAETLRAHVCGALRAKGFQETALDADAGILPGPRELLREVVRWAQQQADERSRARTRAHIDLLEEIEAELLGRDDTDGFAVVQTVARLRRALEKGEKTFPTPPGLTGEKLLDAFERLGVTIIRQ